MGVSTPAHIKLIKLVKLSNQGYQLSTEKPHSTKTTQHLHVVREFEMKSTPDHHLDIQSFQGILGENDGKTVHFGHQKHIEIQIMTNHKSFPSSKPAHKET